MKYDGIGDEGWKLAAALAIGDVEEAVACVTEAREDGYEFTEEEMFDLMRQPVTVWLHSVFVQGGDSLDDAARKATELCGVVCHAALRVAGVRTLEVFEVARN
jgi:hypothetical protein